MRIIQGTVDSNATEKTVRVRVDTYRAHPKLKKRYGVCKRYLAHAEEPCKIGDIVLIQECRPMSKRKKWKVVENVSQKSTQNVQQAA